MLSAKSAHDNERQKLFDEIRHVVGSTHQVPTYLNFKILSLILWIVSGREDIIKEMENGTHS